MAASRVSCIVLSVLLMGLLAMLIYPQCASEQVVLLMLSGKDALGAGVVKNP